jgi:dolichol-phosphate mannosyltransferase
MSMTGSDWPPPSPVQTGPGSLATGGLIVFMLVCGLGAIANVGIARALYNEHATNLAASAVGSVIGVVWNYAVSATLVWRVR